MICDPCKDKEHHECTSVRGKTWCDCQHREGITTEEQSLASQGGSAVA